MLLVLSGALWLLPCSFSSQSLVEPMNRTIRWRMRHKKTALIHFYPSEGGSLSEECGRFAVAVKQIDDDLRLAMTQLRSRIAGFVLHTQTMCHAF